MLLETALADLDDPTREWCVAQVADYERDDAARRHDHEYCCKSAGYGEPT